MPRLNKRQQREQDALSDMQRLSRTHTNATDEEGDSGRVTSKSAFATLAVAEVTSDPSDPEDASTSKSGKPKKKNKKRTAQPNDLARKVTEGPTTTQEPRRSKANKKYQLKEIKKDDIDLALEELALKERSTIGTTGTHAASVGDTSRDGALWSLLSVSTKHLDSDAELRRFFGSKVVNSTKPPPRTRNVAFRSQLTHPPSTWIMQRTNQGLSMRPLDSEWVLRKPMTTLGEKWWTVDHSSSYKQVQLQFLETVQLGDHAGFMQLLREHPWHVDTLLQMSEVARHHEDNTQSSDFVERAIFAFERSFTPSFNISTGLHRLDFDRVENRAFFLALHRQIVLLQRRGTMRTAFEFARLLLSLDPYQDPHGALLYLDFLAIKAGMFEWLLGMWEIVEEDMRRDIGPRLRIRELPGWLWSRAIAIWNIEKQKGSKDHEGSKAALRVAIQTYPHVLPILADKAGISLSAETRGHAAFRISTGWDSFAPGESTLHLLSHMYANRATALWKSPDIAEWLRSTIDASLLHQLTSAGPVNEMREQAIERFSPGTPSNIVRHIIVAELRPLMSFISPQSIPSSMMAYDPLPPLTSSSSYNEQYFLDVAASRRSLARGGNGQWGDEELQQRLLQEMILEEIGRARNAVPGAFDDDVDSEVEDLPAEGNETDVSEGDSASEDAPANPGLLQRVYNLLWGRQDHDGEEENNT